MHAHEQLEHSLSAPGACEELAELVLFNVK